MFQTQLKAAKQITNKLGNSTREGALPSHEASQNMPLSFAYGDVDTEADLMFDRLEKFQILISNRTEQKNKNIAFGV